MGFDWSSIGSAAKPEVKMILDNVVWPEIKKIEDLIPLEILKQLVEGITASAEAMADQALS